ncbi:MAG: hypothetical protein HYX60_08625 [Legionella longbeachae]|nr:hypothetical protein [Legionella longbeachae]
MSKLENVPADLLANVIKAHPNIATALKAINNYNHQDRNVPLVNAQDDAIIDKAILDEKSIASLKLALAKNYISKLTNQPQLLALGKAKDFKEVQTALASAIGVSIDDLNFLKEEDLPALKGAIRIQQFKLQIDEVSRLGSKAHPELIKAFSELNPTQQDKMLTNKKDLLFLIQSNSPKVIQHYLGTENDVSALVKENNSVSQFKKIHNAEIARVLANLYPSEELNDQIIENINNKLKSFSDYSKVRNLPNNQSDKWVYKEIIDYIHTQINQDKNKLYEAFGAVDVYANIDDNNNVFKKVIEEHKQNKPLLEKLDAQTNFAVANKFINLCLQAPKCGAFLGIIADKNAVTSKLWKTFDEAVGENDTSEAFLDKLIPSQGITQEQKDLKNQLSQQLTPTVFNELKIDYLKEQKQKNEIRTPSMTYSKYVINETNKYFEEHDQVFNQDLELIPVHEIGEEKYKLEAGLSKSQTMDLKAHYMKLLDRCKIQKDYLEIKLEEFKYLKTDAQTEEQKNLQKTIDNIVTRLNWYQDRESYIVKDILPEFDKAIKDEERTVYVDSEFDIHTMDRSKMTDLNQGMAGDDKSYNVNARGGIIAGDQDADYISGKKIDGKVVAFNQKIELKTSTNQPVEVKGRFTYDPSPVGALNQFVHGSENRKPARLTLIQFPTCSDTLDPKSNTTLRNEQVNFAFAFAAQILANLDEPPSKDNPIVLKGVAGKEEELKYIWTALVLLGERNPKMNFSPEAIKIRGSNNFDPADEKNLIGQLAKNSCYVRNFKEFEPSIKKVVEKSINKIEKEQGKRAESKELDTQVQQAMKKELDLGRKNIHQKVENLKEKQGVTELSLEHKIK